MRLYRTIISIAILAVAAVAFVTDLHFPHRATSGWLYLPAMFLALLPGMRQYAPSIATLCCGLMVFGVTLAGPNDDLWIVLASRAVVFYGIWMTAGYCFRSRRSRLSLAGREQSGIIDLTPALLWSSGPTPERGEFNQRWAEFTGRSKRTLRGNGWIESVHPDDRRRLWEETRLAYEARQPFKVEYRMRRGDGEFRWLIDSGVPSFTRQGRLAGYAGAAYDVTELERSAVQLEKVVADKNEQLAEAREQLSSLRERLESMAAARVGELAVIGDGDDGEAAETPLLASGAAAAAIEPPRDARADAQIDDQDGARDDDNTPGEAAGDAARGWEARILLALADQEVRLEAARTLEGHGAEIEIVESGDDVVQAAWVAERLGLPFHVVLIDTVLPGKDGYEVVKELRDGGYELPLLASLPETRAEERQGCLDAGFDGVVMRPCEPAELAARIKDWVDRVLEPEADMVTQ